MKDLNCCVTSCDKPLDANYWDLQYQSNSIGWDLGVIAPPLKAYIDQLTNFDLAILIPGCGNTYEAEYLLQKGFTNITVIDIAPTLVDNLKEKFKTNTAITIIHGDFFEHQGNYDVIIEQTFFCALPPQMRQRYVWKMHQLLANKGKLIGLLFNRTFESGPPFGGNQKEYEQLFSAAFELKVIATSYNSVTPRAQTELFIIFEKKQDIHVHCYALRGMHCTSCSNSVTQKIEEIPYVLNAQINSDFTNLIVISRKKMELEIVTNLLAYEPDYSILEIS